MEIFDFVDCPSSAVCFCFLLGGCLSTLDLSGLVCDNPGLDLDLDSESESLDSDPVNTLSCTGNTALNLDVRGPSCAAQRA